MSVQVAESLVAVLAGYFFIGLLLAVAFVSFGVGRIDPAARSMPLRVRFLIMPGVMLLWPLMMAKWLTQKAPPVS